MKAVVMAAGKGTRMQPLTLTMSKGMIPLANRPLLAWTCDFLDFCEEIILVINGKQKDIIEHFSSNPKVRFVFQETLLGTGDALLQAKPNVTGKFLAMNGDDIYGREDIARIAQLDAPALSTFISDSPQLYGTVLADNGYVTDLQEKRENQRPNMVSCGLYMFDEKIFAALGKIGKSPRGEFELTDAIRLLIKEGVQIKGQKIETWIPLSYPWNILDANRYFLDMHGTKIHPSVQIRPGAFIEEPVAIDAGSIVGPNCFIRKYSSIGKNCKVGQAVEVKNSIVMDNSFVSHLSYVGDSIIGHNCNVAAGTLFANLRLDEKNVKMEINGQRADSGKRKLGAVVGDNVKFGARVTIMPGKRIWPDLLIPACMTVEEDIKSELPLSKYQKNGNGG